VSPHRRRVLQLLAGGLAGGLLAGVAATIVCWLAAGTPGAVAAVVSAGVVIVFFAIGQGLQAVVADADPTLALVVALGSYVMRVFLLGMLLSVALADVGLARSVPSLAVVGTTIAVGLGWIGGEVATWSRLRIPVFDSTESAPNQPGTG